MILGTEPRVRPIVEIVERGTRIDRTERRGRSSLDRDEDAYVDASESM